MLKKATAQVAALNKNLQKGIERLIFGLLEEHIDIEIYRGDFSVQTYTSLKMHGLKLSIYLF
jgi:hypothetical protein